MFLKRFKSFLVGKKGAAIGGLIVLVVGALATQSALANPSLTPGVWKNITPSTLDMGNTFGTTMISLAPSHPATIYLSADQRGLWKTTDGGSNWIRLGTPPSSPDYGTSVGYLDSPVATEVDPNNPNHVWAVQGVRGSTLGFWESTDGGITWKMPAGFVTIANTIGTRDMSMLEVDPANFNHVLVGSHSTWSGYSAAGILETKDGGATFTAIPPQSGFTSGSMGIHILSYPKLGLGNDSTWLVQTDGNGFFRTTNRGKNWTKVSDLSSPHAPPQIYYTKTGAIYSGAYQYPCRSTDNGITWQSISNGAPYFYYSGIMGDGVNVYTAISYAGGSYSAQFYTFSESSGTTWKLYNPNNTGAQTFTNGPLCMCFDTVGRIMYSSQWSAGLWALKVVDPGTRITEGVAAVAPQVQSQSVRFQIARARVAIRVENNKIYDVKGRRQPTDRF